METVPVGKTWQLELHCSSTEDSLAELFFWGPSVLVSLNLSSGTSSQCSQSRLFWSSAWRKMVRFLVSGSHGGRGLGVRKSLSLYCTPTYIYSPDFVVVFLLNCACCPPSRDPLSYPLQRINLQSWARAWKGQPLRCM